MTESFEKCVSSFSEYIFPCPYFRMLEDLYDLLENIQVRGSNFRPSALGAFSYLFDIPLRDRTITSNTTVKSYISHFPLPLRK